MNIQLLVVCVVVIGAVAYAGWRVYTAIRRENDPCYGCDGCQLKEKRKKPQKDSSFTCSYSQ